MRFRELIEEVDFYQLSQVESFVEALWDKLNIDVKFTRHFLERLNDPRNGKPITVSELIRLFKKEYQLNGKDIARLEDIEAVMKDLLTNINLPFVIKDTPKGKELVAKTIMRKPNFKTHDPEFVISESSSYNPVPISNRLAMHPGMEFVSISDLRRYRTEDRRTEFKSSMNITEPTQTLLPRLTQELRNGKEIQEPLILGYDGETGRAALLDGNTRLAAVEDAGFTHAPVIINQRLLGGFGAPTPVKLKDSWHTRNWIMPSELGFKTFKSSVNEPVNESKDKLGDCFHIAGRNILDGPSDDLKLVHAMVTGQGQLEGKRFPHAWNEIGDVVLDYSNGRKIVMRKEQYYKLGGVEEIPGQYAKYDSFDAVKNMAKYKHWGPWDLNDEDS